MVSLTSPFVYPWLVSLNHLRRGLLEKNGHWLFLKQLVLLLRSFLLAQMVVNHI